MFILALRRQFVLLMTGFALLLALSCGNSVGPAPYHEQQPQALWFSDLHFDPFADADLVTRLVQADVTQWYALFAGSEEHARTPSSGNGTNHWLLESCLAQMGMQTPRPDLILYTGDFLTHRFNETYATVSGDESEDGLQAFIDKTLAYIVLRLSHYYPQTPVFFCLGNNDAYEDNYGVTPDSLFLSNSAWTLGPGLLKQTRHLTPFFATYPHGGHFVAHPSTTAGWRILSLNAVYFSTHAPSHSEAPAEAQLDWLAAQLAEAAAVGDKVWLLLHIPPGVDVFATRIANGFSEGVPDTIVPLMKEMHLARFKALLTQHASSITAVLAGHIHRDDFRWLGTENDAGASVLIVPSISPVYGNNPAYKVLDYDAATFILQDCETWYFDMLQGDWRHGHRFSWAYGSGALDAVRMRQLWQDLRADPAMRAEYILAYDAFRDTLAIESDFRFYWAGIGHMTSAAYRQALEQWNDPLQVPPAAGLIPAAGQGDALFRPWP
ncbi:metallophosphoesterase [Desulfatitalea alkaliphila]|uniref:Metallophosphoesterase n=1 Tax=Desulfatitalea alkaliphila TaxID=2929485 RepID=A0AA41R1J8_9BACT|nr:metallophosphoesterase [Desulfatitalea alkaliphila]MCJ8499055.1 metallophosphoesterase [Desulfatitalea alkaliphila]